MSEKTAASATAETNEKAAGNFVRELIAQHVAEQRYPQVVTRFPPEPNGYLHIGHVKAICLDFGMAEEFGGRCHLRFDDTNPLTEDTEYVDAIQADIRWLGFDWGQHLYYASDYFERFYEFAVQLITEGKAYVDSLSEAEIREYRGSLTEPGRDSPHRARSVEENLDLLRRMRAGEFPDGAHVVRAKIDMSHPNLKMRDPLLYRIRHAHHHRTGDAWCIYPMYDYAHCLSDALEDISHSLCTLEFENNRDIYDWILEEVGYDEPRPHQYEFARLALTYTMTSKRKLKQLVEEGHVSGWDDPRMPTLVGLRRRGITPSMLRNLIERLGVAKTNSVIDFAQFENIVREELNEGAPRVMAVLEPLKVVIENLPDDHVEWLDAPYFPEGRGDLQPGDRSSRKIPFSRTIYIEREDFQEDPPPKFFRLAPGREVRLRYAYYLRCERVIHDASGNVVELRCTIDPATKGGDSPDGRKVKSTLHWVSAAHALNAPVRLYDRLFREPEPGAGGVDFLQHLNPESLLTVSGAALEPSLAHATPGSRFQFERKGYFVVDSVDSGAGKPIFNRIITLKDAWERAQRQDAPAAEASAPAPAQPEVSPDRDRPPAAARPAALDPAALRAGKSADLQARFDRYTGELGLSVEDAHLLTGDAALSDLFEQALGAHGGASSLAKWVTNELQAVLKERPLADLPLDGAKLASMVRLVDEGTISRPTARQVFAEVLRTGQDPAAIVDSQGLRQVSDAGELRALVQAVLDENPEAAAALKGGDKKKAGFFVGQVMKRSGGKANPRLVGDLIAELGG